MEKTNLLSLFGKENKSISLTFKEIYNLFTDKKVISWEDEFISVQDFNKINKIVSKKNSGMDITFDIGYRYFRGNKTYLEKGVFVPQFDTEQIVDLVIQKGIISGRALEVGAGSGVISISLCQETKLIIDSLDINPMSIALSIKNKKNLLINYINEDFFLFKSEYKYDLLISNPPYIQKGDLNVEDWVKRNQPEESLYANKGGFLFYISFFQRAKELLNKGAYIIVEIGFEQSDEVCNLARQISDDVEVVKDYNGLDRFVVVKYEY